MSRRRLIFLFTLVLVFTALYALWRSPDWGARLVEHALGGYFHRTVRVEKLRFRAFPVEVEVRGLRVDGASPDAPPFLEVPSARVRPSFAPLRGNRLVLSRVRVEGLRLRIHAYHGPPEGPGGDDIPRLGGGRGGGGGRGLQVSIERLVIVGGRVRPEPRPGASRPRPAQVPGTHGGSTRGGSGRARLLRPRRPALRRRSDDADRHRDRSRDPPGPADRPAGADHRGADRSRPTAAGSSSRGGRRASSASRARSTSLSSNATSSAPVSSWAEPRAGTVSSPSTARASASRVARRALAGPSGAARCHASPCGCPTTAPQGWSCVTSTSTPWEARPLLPSTCLPRRRAVRSTSGDRCRRSTPRASCRCSSAGARWASAPPPPASST